MLVVFCSSRSWVQPRATRSVCMYLRAWFRLNSERRWVASPISMILLRLEKVTFESVREGMST